MDGIIVHNDIARCLELVQTTNDLGGKIVQNDISAAKFAPPAFSLMMLVPSHSTCMLPLGAQRADPYMIDLLEPFTRVAKVIFPSPYDHLIWIEIVLFLKGRMMFAEAGLLCCSVSSLPKKDRGGCGYHRKEENEAA